MELILNYSNRREYKKDVFEILYELDQSIKKYVGIIGYYLLLPISFLISYPIIILSYRKIINDMKNYNVTVTKENIEVCFNELYRLEHFYKITGQICESKDKPFIYKSMFSVVQKAHSEAGRVISELRRQLFPLELSPEQTEQLRTQLGDCSDWDEPEMDAYDYHYHPLKQNECTSPAT